MKKIFTFLIALIASVGIIYASNKQVDGIWYDFNESNKTATVTYRGSGYLSFDDEYSGSVVIPPSVTYNGVTYSVTSIRDYAFRECSSLTSVTIPNSVICIGAATFRDCSSLTSVTIGNSVTSIGEWAFKDCYDLTSITINSDAIVNKAYSSSYNLSDIFGSQVTKYIIGDNVKGIGDYAFAYCFSLTSMTIGNSVTSIGEWAFRSCSPLTSITIPNSVTSIGRYAFVRCSSLSSITIPNSVTSIGNFAFSECSSLTSVTCKATTPPTVGSSAFYGVSKSIPVYVPCGCVEAYKAAYGWKDFTNIQGPSLAEYSITVGVNATKMGTAKVDINNACSAQISAKPNIGYHFVQWSDGVVNNPRSIVLTQDTVLIAEFAEIPSYVVEVIYNPDHGTVNGQGTYKEDEEVILTATANDGYKFHKWSNGVTDNPYTFIVKSDVTLEAKFTSTEGVEEVLNSEVHTTKFIRDGQVLILRNGKTYTMQGQEVK